MKQQAKCAVYSLLLIKNEYFVFEGKKTLWSTSYTKYECIKGALCQNFSSKVQNRRTFKIELQLSKDCE